MGDWTPTATWFDSLLSPGVTTDDLSRPYPFYLASPVEETTPVADVVPQLGDWQIEWKWDGIRAQIVKRAGAVHLWSRGEELITPRFPEIADAAATLPDGTVLDGEVLAFRDDRPLPFSSLQQRIGRQLQVARKARDVPVVFMAYDVLEQDGQDVRSEPLRERRRRLEEIVSRLHPAAAPSSAREQLLPFDESEAQGTTAIRVSPVLAAFSHDLLAELRGGSRARGVEGVMLKRLDSPYGVGRKRGDWWKWKINPFTIDAVLIYAQPGSGKRASR
jgi:DNA ligase-1